MYCSILSFFIFFDLLLGPNVLMLENCYRVADWSPYRDPLDLKEKNKNMFRLLHDDEVSFLLLPYSECLNKGCQFGYNTLGVIVLPRSDRKHFFEYFLRYARKYKFKKCTLKEFFALDFRYHFDQTGNPYPTTEWLDNMSSVFIFENILDNYILMPLQWFYDSRSIGLYKKRLEAYYHKSSGAFDGQGNPIPSYIPTTTSQNQFFYYPVENNDKTEL